MKDFIKLIGIVALAAIIVFPLAAQVPESLPVAERWASWIDDNSRANINYSIANDGVVTVNVSGEREYQNDKASMVYSYTSKEDTAYAYVFEAWTQSGSRNLDVVYYFDHELYLTRFVAITNERKTYTVRGGKLPAGGITLGFNCANQTGTFYLKVLEIREIHPDEGLWNKYIDHSTKTTLDYSVARDGVVTVNVGGSVSEHEWYAQMVYQYNAKANTSYTYIFEAWTQSGNRDMGFQYYADHNTSTYFHTNIPITNRRTTYTITGQAIIKGGNHLLEFRGANQLGTFYLKVLEIREATPEDLVQASWRKWVANDSTATLDYSVARDGVVTVDLDGSIYLGKDDLDRALKDINEAIHLNQRNQWAYRGRGFVYRDKGDYDRAITDFTQAINIDPNIADFYHDRGYTYLSRGRNYGNIDDFNKAIEDFTQAIKLNPNNSWHYHQRGWTYRERVGRNNHPDLDKAIDDYTQAINLNPGEGSHFLERGGTYLEKGEHDRAFSDYNEAIRLNPNIAWAHWGLGQIYIARGDYDRAIEAFQNAVRLDPNNNYFKDLLEEARRRGR